MEFELERDLIKDYMALRQQNLVAAKELYFAQIMPRLRLSLEKSPEHVKLQQKGFETLVSLMGFSPETTVICTLILRPRKLALVYSSQAEELFNLAIKYLIDQKILNFADIRYSEVDSFDPLDINKKLSGLIARQGSRVFDVTGGTKLMSATAGHLAWEHGYSLCYLDGHWDPKVGAAGLEQASRLRIYTNPSEQQGFEIRGHGIDLYEHGNFVAARKSFEESRNRISDAAFEHLGIALSSCYTSLADLNREQLRIDLDELQKTLGFAGVIRLLQGRLEMSRHSAALLRVADSDRDAMAALFLELATLYMKQERHDFASLLIYRSMEALVEICLRGSFPSFDMSDPDYTIFGEPQLPEKANKLHGGRFRGLPPTVGLEAGFTLLMILGKVKKEAFGQLRDEAMVGKVAGYANKRNRSILAHGTQTLARGDSKALLDGANLLVQALLGARAGEFDQLRKDLRSRELATVMPKQESARAENG
jgi:hypothetical protein